MAYILPGSGGQTKDPYQAIPIANTYSPRLFGSPPQLTNLCDMRLTSANGTEEGPVGDFYYSQILKDAQICNFVIGRALFTGGFAGKADAIRQMIQYRYAMSKYDMYDKDQSMAKSKLGEQLTASSSLEAFKSAMGEEDGGYQSSNLTMNDEGDAYVSALNGETTSILESIGAELGLATAVLKSSISVQQPFYTFESDWFTYMQNVKMMINTAVIMLGLQQAVVRIGNKLVNVGLQASVEADKDVWSRYRFITTEESLPGITGLETQLGDNAQYVSFMVEPSVSESYTNNVGNSQLYSTMTEGAGSGTELAFITNSSVAGMKDDVIKLIGNSQQAARDVMKSLSKGSGRFTAAIAAGMTSSYLGDHVIYPQIFTEASSSTSMSVNIHLSSDSGDPYSYLINILVPLFHILGMTLPKMSKNNGAAYAYPPLIQCNIPGMWGTRLGMITSVTVNKNPAGKDLSINGYPLAIDVGLSIADLQHVMVTTPMNEASLFLNNRTMFDYIAECAGVDKYRVNGAIRVMTRLALATSVSGAANVFHNFGQAVLNDVTTYVNKLSGNAYL